MTTNQRTGRHYSTLFDACRQESLVDLVPSRVRAMLVHSLAAAAAGDRLLCDAGDRSPLEPTSLPLLLVTDECRLPSWIEFEWSMAKSQHECVERFYYRKAVAPFGHCADLRELVEFEAKRPPIRFHRRQPFHQPSRGRQPPCPETNGRASAVIATGLDAVLNTLEATDPPRHDAQGTTRIVGWISRSDLPKLARRVPPDLLGRSAWLVDAPTSLGPGLRFRESQFAEHGGNLLDLNMRGGEPAVGRPPLYALNAARQLITRIRHLAGRLPACLRAHAIPSDRMPLHALCLTEMLHQGSCSPSDAAVRISTHWDCHEMALETAVRHLHWLRVSYPADDRGFFTGTDLGIFRQLDAAPRQLRDIQRSMRGVQRAELLRGLERAAAAGLACEPAPGAFAVIPPPPPVCREWILSEIEGICPNLDSMKEENRDYAC